MKKIIALLLAGLCLSGCQALEAVEESAAPQVQFVQQGQTHTDYAGIEVQIADAAWSEDGFVLKVDWINRTAHEATFGASYVIERKEGEDWVSCQTGDDAVFIAIAYILSPGQTREEVYHVSPAFDVSKAGTYRFRSDFSVEQMSHQSLWAEFSLTAHEERSQTPVHGELPGLKLRHENGSVPLAPAGFDWTYPNGDGTMTTVIADSQHPLFCQKLLKPIHIGGQSASLEFEGTPDFVEIHCWPDSAWNSSETPSQPVLCDNEFVFALKTGGYIYEISAKWEEKENNHFGSVSYYAYIIYGEDHTHGPAAEPQTVEDPVTGYCGNTQTTLHIDGEVYTFWGGNSVTLTDILINLNYDPMGMCRCRPEYTVDTEFGSGYGINLTAGYARCEEGQAKLTQEQIDTIAEIINWAETTNCEYPIHN